MWLPLGKTGGDHFTINLVEELAYAWASLGTDGTVTNQSHEALGICDHWETQERLLFRLTWRSRADINDVALRPRDVFVLHLQGGGFHINGVLGPGLEILKSKFGICISVLWKVYVHHVPAIGATAILAIKLCDILGRSEREPIQTKGFGTNLQNVKLEFGNLKSWHILYKPMCDEGLIFIWDCWGLTTPCSRLWSLKDLHGRRLGSVPTSGWSCCLL